MSPGHFERLAATYSRGSYTTTTIGKAAFDGRVLNGIGSDHSFMATKLLHTATADSPQCTNTVFCKRSQPKRIRQFSENYTQEALGALLQFAS